MSSVHCNDYVTALVFDKSRQAGVLFAFAMKVASKFWFLSVATLPI